MPRAGSGTTRSARTMPPTTAVAVAAQRGLDADARHITCVEAALETRPQADHDRSVVRARHLEEHAAGLRGCEGFHRAPAETRGQPSEQQQRLRRVNITAVHVDGEARTYPGDPIQERTPCGHVEELRDELAPMREPSPVEIGDA